MELVDLGASKRDPVTNAALVQCKGSGKDTDDAPDYGNVPMFQCLGLTAFPYPADEKGGAQGILSEVEGLDGVIVGARDTRSAKVVGNGEPGDTILHATGPEQAAQVQLKEKKRQAVLVSKDSRGETMALVLDGKNDKVQIAAFGMMFEMSRDNGFVVTDGEGGTLQIKGGAIMLTGQIVLGGRVPSSPVLSGSPPGVPTPGVFVGL